MNPEISSKINRSLVLALIHRHPLISRAELAKMTGLDRSTVTHILKHLLREKLAEEVRKGKAGSRGGRCPILLQVRYDTRFMIAVDVGTEKIEAVITNLKGEEVDRRTLPIRRGDPLLERLCEILDHLRKTCRNRFERSVVIGIACPGVIDTRKGVVRLNLFHHWRDVPVAEQLMERYGKPVFLENDANAAAMGELQGCDSEGIRSLIYLFIRQSSPDSEHLLGVGGAVIFDGRLWHGSHNCAGEVSLTVNSLLQNVPVYPDAISPHPASEHGSTTLDDLLRAAAAENPQALQAVYSITDIIGKFLSELAAFLDPESVMVYIYPPRDKEDFLARIRGSFFQRHETNGNSTVHFLQSKMEEPAMLHGVIALAQEKIFVPDTNHCSLLFQ